MTNTGPAIPVADGHVRAGAPFWILTEDNRLVQLTCADTLCVEGAKPAWNIRAAGYLHNPRNCFATRQGCLEHHRARLTRERNATLVKLVELDSLLDLLSTPELEAAPA